MDSADIFTEIGTLARIDTTDTSDFVFAGGNPSVTATTITIPADTALLFGEPNTFSPYRSVLAYDTSNGIGLQNDVFYFNSKSATTLPNAGSAYVASDVISAGATIAAVPSP